MNRLELNLNTAQAPAILIDKAAAELRGALAKKKPTRRRDEVAADAGLSPALVTAALNADLNEKHAEKARRMSLLNLGLIAAALGYGLRVEVYPLDKSADAETENVDEACAA